MSKILNFPLHNEDKKETKEVSEKDKIPTIKDSFESEVEKQLEELKQNVKTNSSQKKKEEVSKEDEVFECRACGTVHTENVIPINVLVYAGRKDALPATFFVCPNCCTLQLPRQAMDEMIRQIKSNIIIPR